MSIIQSQSQNTPVPSIIVEQRIMTKKTRFKCQFYDGYAIVTYSNEKVAEGSYKQMLKQGTKAKLKGNVLTEYRRNLSAWEIFELYRKDIENAMLKNSMMFSVKYHLE